MEKVRDNDEEGTGWGVGTTTEKTRARDNDEEGQRQPRRKTLA